MIRLHYGLAARHVSISENSSPLSFPPTARTRPRQRGATHLTTHPLSLRARPGTRLTPEGEKLLNYPRRIIRLNNEAVAAFDDNRLEGTLRIGTPDDYADRYMPDRKSVV